MYWLMKKLLQLTTLCVTVLSSVAFVPLTTHAQVGETILQAKECGTAPFVQAYNIHYGTFNAAEVMNGSHVNPGFKQTGGGGVQRSDQNSVSDYYVYISNPCARTRWTVTVHTSEMVENGVLPVTPSAIPANRQRLAEATDGLVRRFNGSPSNSAVTAPVVASQTTLETARVVLNHDGTNNGVAGDY